MLLLLLVSGLALIAAQGWPMLQIRRWLTGAINDCTGNS